MTKTEIKSSRYVSLDDYLSKEPYERLYVRHKGVLYVVELGREELPDDLVFCRYWGEGNEYEIKRYSEIPLQVRLAAKDGKWTNLEKPSDFKPISILGVITYRLEYVKAKEITVNKQRIGKILPFKLHLVGGGK